MAKKYELTKKKRKIRVGDTEVTVRQINELKHKTLKNQFSKYVLTV